MFVSGDPLFQQWGYFVSWRYNGCKGCSSQEAKYRDGTLLLNDEFGADFWAQSTDLCALIPPEGRTIEEDDLCYRALGPHQFWRGAEGGHAGTFQWTKASDGDSPSNSPIWRLKFESAGDYEVRVYSDGGVYGMSRQAPYLVQYAGGSTLVLVDQSASEGWISLGVFPFDTGDGYQVRLDDNTGEPWADDPGGVKVMFDALRVDPPDATIDPVIIDPDVPGDGDVEGVFCAVSSHGVTGAWPLLFALVLLGRRRRLYR